MANPDVPGWLNNLPLLGTLARTFGVVNWRPTGIGELLIVHGAWLAVFVIFAAWMLLCNPYYVRCLRARADLYLALGTISGALAIIWAPALVLVGWPLALAVWFTQHEEDLARRAVAALFAAGLLLVLVPEFFYIQDAFGDRMNTVFKLYFQAWLLLSLAAAGALTVLLQRVRRQSRAAVLGALAVMLVVTLPYVRLSAWDWTNQFDERRGLNGADFIAQISPGDAAAIAWVRNNAQPDDVLVENPGCSYGEYYGVPMDRVSAFTGVPTLIGWQGHEDQWRRGQYSNIDDVLNTRADLAAILLSGGSVNATPATILVLGRFESVANPACGLTVARGDDVVMALEAAGWRLELENGDTRIFVRADRATANSDRMSVGAR